VRTGVELPCSTSRPTMPIVQPWHEDDAFWTDVEPVLFSAARLSQAGADVDGVLRLAGVRTDASVLDLGCGVGRHSLEFSRRGFRVTGVDRQSTYLARARALASERSLDVEWVESDMRTFTRPAAFDLAVSLLTSFGFFENPEDDRRVLANVHAGLRIGGVLVMEMMGKEVLARRFVATDWHEEPDGTLLLEQRAVGDGWRQLAVRWIVLRANRRSEHRFTLRLYSGMELEIMLRDVGFRRVDLFGSLGGAAYDQQAERLVAVARKT